MFFPAQGINIFDEAGTNARRFLVYLPLSKLERQLSTALFKLLDTDNNGLIDAIEFVSAMACASGEQQHFRMKWSTSLEWKNPVSVVETKHYVCEQRTRT